MSGRIPKPLQAALAAMIASMGAGGGVYLAEQERTSQLQTEYLRTVAADTSTSDAIKLAMVLGSYYESSFRHIGTPYVDRLGKGQPLTVCNGITGAGVVAGRYYTPADCYRGLSPLARGNRYARVAATAEAGPIPARTGHPMTRSAKCSTWCLVLQPGLCTCGRAQARLVNCT